MRTPQLSFTSMYLLLLMLDPGGGAVGDPFLTIELPIIAVAVVVRPTVLATIILFTYFYRRLDFIKIITAISTCCAWGTFILIMCIPLHIHFQGKSKRQTEEGE